MSIQGNKNSFFTCYFKVGPKRCISYYSYNPHKGNTKYHLSNISKGLDELNSKYDNILIIGDLK